MSLRVWSPLASTPVLLKAEDSRNDSVSVETIATTASASTWETLVFDRTNERSEPPALDLDAIYDKASVFPSYGVLGSAQGQQTFYVDDLVFLGAVFSTDCDEIIEPPPGELITFDDPLVTYYLIDFEGAANAMVVTDPDGAGNMVARAEKPVTAGTAAGTTFATNADESIAPLPIPASDTQRSLRVQSPRANIPVLLKTETANDPTRSVETLAMTTQVDTWETLVFDFANARTGTSALNATYVYNQVSVFFGFGRVGDAGGSGTFYYDNLGMVP